jgi:hypothetical protein
VAVVLVSGFLVNKDTLAVEEEREDYVQQLEQQAEAEH